MTHDSDGILVDFDLRSPAVALFLAATVLAVAGQGALQQLLAGRSIDPADILEWRVLPLSIWMAAAPLLLRWQATISRSASERPVRWLLGHLLLAAGWTVVSNLLMRIPLLLKGAPAHVALSDAVSGAVAYAPGAAAAYVALLAFGELRRRSAAVTSEARSRPDSGPPTHVAIRNDVRIHLVPRAEIRWIEADGDHVRIHTIENEFRTRATLTSFERELEDDGFLRIHRSALVHPRAIREIQRYYRGDHVAILRDGREIRIPRTRGDILDVLLAPIGRESPE